jgi:hypothetical protein
MARKFDIEKFNNILKEHNQQLRAEKINGKEIFLSNGLVLNSIRDVRLCKRRVMTGDKIWKENFDAIYSLDKKQGDITQKKCKSLTSVKGGINCQKRHSKKIKSNLNTGTPWNKGLTGLIGIPHSEETKLKIGNANRGKKNGMFGKKLSIEEKTKKSQKMKDLILSGKFTPNSNNRNTHWESFYKNKKYRSSWEALYQYFDIEAEYETLRIPYKFDNTKYVYIIDFINNKTKTVIEVKPKELLQDKKTKSKISALQDWCRKNEYTLLLADKNYFLSKSIPNDLTDFDIKTQNKIKNLYETN